MIKRTFITLIAAAAAALFASPALAVAAPVEVTNVSVSPWCTHPGGSVTVSTSVRNTTWWFWQFYAKGWTTYYGVTVNSASTQGPLTLPPQFPVTSSQSAPVPFYLPWGWYTIHAGVGPTWSNPTGYSQGSASFLVNPLC